jgi:cell shape-determining protein MreC
MAGTESLSERVARLEQEVADNQVLRRRVEELTQQLGELLVAVEDKDQARVEELLAALRGSA